MSMGYLNRNEGYGSVNQEFVGRFPADCRRCGLQRAAGHAFNDELRAAIGNNAGVNIGNITTRPTFIINDAVTWTKSAHTLKVGMEWRKIMGNIHANGNQAGTFNFARGATGLIGANSGSPIASFLLGAVDDANSTFRAVDSSIRGNTRGSLHAGDTWRVNDKLTLDYGLRWDYFSPSSEKYDVLSFFDPIGANPGAGGRPDGSRLPGTAMERRASARGIRRTIGTAGSRRALAASTRSTTRRCVRAGWGIFYTQAFYPGWGGGISLRTASRTTPTFSSVSAGSSRRSSSSKDSRRTSRSRRIIRSDYRNGQSILYRPLDANERPYSHQWNITVDRELGHHLALSVAYVGSAGRRLPSSIDPINAIDPSLPVDGQCAVRRVRRRA